MLIDKVVEETMKKKNPCIVGLDPEWDKIPDCYKSEAGKLRRKMKRNYFLVPGFGAQGGSARDIVSCFNEDGLGALISSSRGILYQYVGVKEYDGSREMYGKIVREQAVKMKEEVYQALKEHCSEMKY